VASTISSSPLWSAFKILQLTENMRLTSQLQHITALSSPADVAEYTAACQYADTILAVSNGDNLKDFAVILDVQGDKDFEIQTIMLPELKYETEGMFMITFIETI
jgi:hypothetical protein